jgi:hypothetical protein
MAGIDSILDQMLPIADSGRDRGLSDDLTRSTYCQPNTASHAQPSGVNPILNQIDAIADRVTSTLWANGHARNAG